jgi:hypothetical protein
MFNRSIIGRIFMKKPAWLWILLLAQLISTVATSAWAASNITWKVTDSNGVEKCSGTGTPGQVFIKKDPCGNVSILDGAAGAAKISATDLNADILTLNNTKIKANADISNWHLIFERELDSGPTGGNWWYVTRIVGILDNSDAGNAISVNTKMFNPLGTLNTDSTLSVTAAEAQPFSKKGGPKVNPALNNQARKIIVDVTFTLKNTKTVDFGYAGAYLQVRAQNTAPDLEERENASLQEILQTLSEAGEACLGVRFSDSSCVGVHMLK